MWWIAHGEHEVPAGSEWLSAREQDVLAGIRYTKRHVEFRTRRWTAKRAVATVLQRATTLEALAAIEIRNHLSGAPFVEIAGQRAAIDISISDRAGWAVCLLGPPGGAGGPVGIDLEIVEPRSEGFVADFFTAAEQTHVRALPAGTARHEAANLIWSAKEAALKVRKVGLRADTRDVDVAYESSRRDDGWARLTVSACDGAVYPGWWRRDGAFLMTIASMTPSPPPARLDASGDLAAGVPVDSWLARPLV